MAINPLNPSFNAPLQRTLAQTQANALNSLTKLATGDALTRPSENPAAFITSEQLRSALASIEAEGRTLQRQQSVVATADGALGEVSSLLSDARALAVANANTGGLSQAEIDANNLELSSIMSSINQIAGGAEFNGQALFDGELTLESGDVAVDVDAVSTSALGLEDLVNLSPEDAVAALDAAQSQIFALRGELGAYESNTIDSQLSALQVSFENVAAANSLIRDTDFAAETSNLARFQTLERAGILALKLSNSSADKVLRLIS